jgi:phosphohistidine phosphatase
MAEICFLRHGEAEDEHDSGDSARELTPRGRAQASAAGAALAAIDFRPDACLTSPRVRALDTATLACASLGIEPEIVEAIGSGSYDSLDLMAGRGNVLIVGHQPVLAMEVARLTGAVIRMKKGGIALVDPGRLLLLLGPDELSLIAENG